MPVRQQEWACEAIVLRCWRRENRIWWAACRLSLVHRPLRWGQTEMHASMLR